MAKNKQNIVYKDINSLIESEYNPRQLKKEQYDNIANSIKRFGIVDPIIVNKNKNRENIIIGGHQRVKVAKDLKIKEVPCVELDLTIEKEKELNVRLNKNTGEWNFDVLADLFDVDELIDWGFKKIELGFNIDKIDPVEEWQGMPEFELDDLSPHRQIIVSFEDDKGVEEFGKLINRQFTERTKSIWFPERERNILVDKAYVDEESA